MYVPEHFAMPDPDAIAEFVEQAGAADLVTFDGTRLVSTLLPVIWDRSGPESGSQDESGNGRLIGHLALSNPQWSTASADVPALVIVHGPQAYISPSWYESKKRHGRVVPTWNYTAVHFTGPVRFHRDERFLRDVVTRLTERHESGRDQRWRVSDAPERFVAGQLRAIVGVELLIEQVEAKAKLSQNRPAEDQAGVVTALHAEPDAGSRAIAGLMAEHVSRGTTG